MGLLLLNHRKLDSVREPSSVVCVMQQVRRDFSLVNVMLT